MALIQTEGLTKRFGSVTAVDGLTVDVSPGDHRAGRRQRCRQVDAAQDPARTAARHRRARRASSTSTWRRDGPAIRERVGYMPEHDCLPPDVSATEFVVHMARMSGLPTTAARERAADILRHVGLYEERYRPMGGYSTGMRQRVKLAQALVHDPSLVLLDEPTNGLDPAGRDDMLELIRRIGTEFGISVIVTSHLLGELERVCDGIVVIDGGRLLRHSTTASVTAETAGGHASRSTATTTALRARLSDAGVAVQSRRPAAPRRRRRRRDVRRGARRRRRPRPRPGPDGAAAAPDDRDLHRQPRPSGGVHV